MLREFPLNAGRTYYYWLRRSNLWLSALMAVLMLANISLRWWRLEPMTRSANSIAIFAVAFCTVAIWLNYLSNVRQLNQLPKEVSEKLVARLSRSAFAMCLLGYVMALEGLFLQHG